MSHKEIYALLPWYVNGTLSIEQRQAVEAELTTCRECAAEVQALNALAQAVAGATEQYPEPSPFLLSRALSRVEEFEREKDAERQFLRGWWRRQVPVVASVLLAVPLVFVAAFAAVIAARSFQSSTPLAMPEPASQPISVAFEDRAKVTAARNADASYRVPAASQAQTIGAIAPVAGPTHAPQVIKRGDVSLLVADVEPAIHALYGIARSQSGDVTGLQDQTPNQPGQRHTASVEVRVPAVRFDAAMDAVAGVGRVASRSAQAEDAGDQIVDLQARLRNLRHTESDLLRIMDRSGKIGEVLDVENQLSTVREQIEQLDAQLKGTQNRVAYATIDVALADEVGAATVRPSFGARVGDAWKAAVESVKDFSVGIVDALVWLLAFAPYLVLAALGVGLAWLMIRRRLPA